MDFDISKLNISAPSRDILNILKNSETLLKNEKLDKKDLILLGKSLNAIQHMSILDKFIELLSHVSKKTEDGYLINRAKKYEMFLRSPIIDMVFLKNVINHKKSHLMEQLQSNIGLQFASSEKKTFLESQIHSSTISNIINRQSRLPIIQEMLTNLSSKYEEWDDEIPDDQKVAIQKQLTEQHKNLEEVSNALNQIENDENQDVLKDLNSKKIILETNKNSQISIKKSIANALNEVKKNSEQTSENLKPVQNPISKSIIQLTASLFSVIRSVKAIAAEKKIEELEVQNQSTNIVIPFKDPSTSTKANPKGETIAYYKEGTGNEKAAGEMEKLMWELSGLMGVENFFAPTATVSLKDNSGGERAGGVQVAQQGTDLKSYLQNPKKRTAEISQEELIKGTLVTLAFGMFDAHPENILVDSTGHIKFFDNTRSMPNSNGVVKWGDEIISGYRSALLSLKGNLKTFSPTERSSISEEIQNYKSKISNIENFLESPAVKARLGILPPGWFDKQESLTALKERLDSLESAIKNPNVKNLRDLVFACNPDYKYIAALHLFDEAIGNRSISLGVLQQEHFGEVGFRFVDQLIDNTSQKGVDPAKVWDWCNDSKLSFEDVLKKMIQENSLRRKPGGDNQIEAKKRQENADRIIIGYTEKAKIDFKDIPRAHTHLFSLQLASQNLKDAGFEITNVDLEEDPDGIKNSFNMDPEKKFLVHRDSSFEPRRLYLYYIDKDQTIKKSQIDYLTKPGLLKIDNKFLKAEEIAANFTFIQ